VSFMSHVFSQCEHPFGQCGHFNQVEPFEKPWFVVMMPLLNKTLFVEKKGKEDMVFVMC
jgi:hypothetical protein